MNAALRLPIALVLALPRLFVRVSRQETQMENVHDEIATLKSNFGALKQHVIEQDTKLAALSGAQAGDTLTDEDATILHDLVTDSTAVVSGFAPAASTPATTTAPIETTPVEATTDPLAITPTPATETTADPAFGA